MYKVTKATGNSSNVIVENTETKASVIIGRISMAILNILKDVGYDTDHGLTFSDEWSLRIDKDTATKLTHLAMSMKKPIRDQSKKNKDIQPKKDNKQIDAMDVLLGLANYS